MAAKSILDTHPGECFWCCRETETELHHIYFGTGRRTVSDRMGFVCYLCPECHRGTDGVHGKNGNALNKTLKKICQMKYEETHSREEFIETIGRSYL